MQFRRISSPWDLLLLLGDSNTLWWGGRCPLNEGRKKVAQGPVQGVMLFMYIPPSFVSAKEVLDWTGPRGGLITTEMLTVSHFYDRVPRAFPASALWNADIAQSTASFQWVFSRWDGTLHWGIHSSMGWFATAKQRSHRHLPLN